MPNNVRCERCLITISDTNNGTSHISSYVENVSFIFLYVFIVYLFISRMHTLFPVMTYICFILCNQIKFQLISEISCKFMFNLILLTVDQFKRHQLEHKASEIVFICL